MLHEAPDVVYVERCVNCFNHSWCTNHDEDKYKDYYEKCKKKIVEIDGELNVVENEIPLGFDLSFGKFDESSWKMKMNFPRIGAFEVYFRGKCVFSKLSSMKWPNVEWVADRIKECLDCRSVDIKKTKKSKSFGVKTSLKSRKVKKMRTRNVTALDIDSPFKSVDQYTNSTNKTFSEIFKKNYKLPSVSREIIGQDLKIPPKITRPKKIDFFTSSTNRTSANDYTNQRESISSKESHRNQSQPFESTQKKSIQKKAQIKIKPKQPTTSLLSIESSFSKEQQILKKLNIRGNFSKREKKKEFEGKSNVDIKLSDKIEENDENTDNQVAFVDDFDDVGMKFKGLDGLHEEREEDCLKEVKKEEVEDLRVRKSDEEGLGEYFKQSDEEIRRIIKSKDEKYDRKGIEGDKEEKYGESDDDMIEKIQINDQVIDDKLGKDKESTLNEKNEEEHSCEQKDVIELNAEYLSKNKSGQSEDEKIENLEDSDSLLDKKEKQTENRDQNESSSQEDKKDLSHNHHLKDDESKKTIHKEKSNSSISQDPSNLKLKEASVKEIKFSDSNSKSEASEQKSPNSEKNLSNLNFSEKALPSNSKSPKPNSSNPSKSSEKSQGIQSNPKINKSSKTSENEAKSDSEKSGQDYKEEDFENEEYSEDNEESFEENKENSEENQEKFEENQEYSEENQENSEENQEYSEENQEYSEENQEYSEENQENSEKNQEKSENSQKSLKKLEENSSKIRNSRENLSKSGDDDDMNYSNSSFQSQDLKSHPMRAISKSFTVNLPLFQETKKKINYENLSDFDAIFIIKSSDPDQMEVREELVEIPKGTKAKIQLKFSQVDEEIQKNYYLYIDRDGTEWECIEIVAVYSNN